MVSQLCGSTTTAVNDEMSRFVAFWLVSAMSSGEIYMIGGRVVDEVRAKGDTYVDWWCCLSCARYNRHNLARKLGRELCWWGGEAQ